MFKVVLLTAGVAWLALAAAPPVEPVTLAFVGDIMMDRGVAWKVNTVGGGEYGWLFDQIAPALQEPDIMFGNLEGPISDRGRNVGSIYSFRMDPKVVPALATAGFDVLSVANNHAGDWTHEAFADTVTRLEASGITPVGDGGNLQVLERAGLKFGFLAFSDVGPGFVGIPTNLAQSIRAAVERVDFMIVSFHFGEEYMKEPSDRQKTLAHGAIEAGADLVVGHHPHVVQPIEYYKNGLIAYSLGNFIFDQGFSAATMKGGWLEVKVEKGKIISATEKSVQLSSEFKPTLKIN